MRKSKTLPAHYRKLAIGNTIFFVIIVALAAVTQSVEFQPSKLTVAGSIPVRRSKESTSEMGCFSCF